MKFHKLVKSIDYVTYPVLIELRKINSTLGHSLSSFREILISALMGVILEITPISQLIIDKFFKESTCSYLVSFSKIDNAAKIVAIMLTILFYISLLLHRFIKERWGSNKGSVNLRKDIVFEFYKVVIPKLVSVKSIVEQHDESMQSDADKRFLLLLQAKYELSELIELLSHLNILEIEKHTNVLTKDSKDVLDQIGEEAYFAVLLNVLKDADLVYSKIKDCTITQTHDILKSLQSQISSAHIYSVCKQISISNELCNKVVKEHSLLLKKMLLNATAQSPLP